MDINQLSEQFYRTLTEQFITSMTSQIRNRVVEDVSREIANFDIHNTIRQRINDALDHQIQTFYYPEMPTPPVLGSDNLASGLMSEFRTRTDAILEILAQQVKDQVISDIHSRLNSVNVDGMIQTQVEQALARSIRTYNFPDRSIPGSSVSSIGLEISADNIKPGQIKNFESTGIQDKAASCQVTILDAATVFENTLVAARLEIAGDAKISGNVNLDFIDRVADRTIQRIETQYSDGSFDQYCDRVFAKIESQGLDSVKIRVNGQPIVENNKLADTVTTSNLQKVGALRELQVIGETYLDETLYVASKRVGINTFDPERAFDLWDQEVQVVIGKQQRDTAFIGTNKNQNLVLGTNNRDQLRINIDGTVAIPYLTINHSTHTSSAQQPVDNRPAGQIVWNEQPIIGAPIGWVSLGGARWARFGTVTE
jgi:hypothetical protein